MKKLNSCPRLDKSLAGVCSLLSIDIRIGMFNALVVWLHQLDSYMYRLIAYLVFLIKVSREVCTGVCDRKVQSFRPDTCTLYIEPAYQIGTARALDYGIHVLCISNRRTRSGQRALDYGIHVLCISNRSTRSGQCVLKIVWELSTRHSITIRNNTP